MRKQTVFGIIGNFILGRLIQKNYQIFRTLKMALIIMKFNIIHILLLSFNFDQVVFDMTIKILSLYPIFIIFYQFGNAYEVLYQE